MGFKQGEGIGKDGAGAVNPLGINVRAAARAGLGVEEEANRIADEQFQRQKAEADEMRATFLARQRTNFETRQVLRDVIKGRKACESLDRPLGLNNPHLWPEVPHEKSMFTDADTGEQVFTGAFVALSDSSLYLCLCQRHKAAACESAQKAPNPRKYGLCGWV